FASDFLQIPPRDGHPCLSLTVPTAKPVMDFHHQVANHAERTYKNAHFKKMKCAFIILYMRQAIFYRYPLIHLFHLLVA
ncbi:hypothetical protein, partial [Staphylococcus simulans]|uniref:hypothetical protein n=1 Tax=Staphylococcus simulans TaxID=1286 RepID=UPI003F7DA2A8